MLFSKGLGKHTVSAYSEEKEEEGVGGGVSGGVGGGVGGGVDRRKRRVDSGRRGY